MQHFTDESIEQFFAHGLSVPSRTLYLGSWMYIGENTDEESGTDFKMADRLIKGLHILNNTGTSLISIIMNNPGGNEYHGLAIYDAINKSENMTMITVFGHAMSMGSWILQAATYRKMHKNSTLMLHYGSQKFDGHTNDAIRTAKEYERINDLMEETYLSQIRKKHRNYPKERLQQLITFDKYLTAQEAVDLGLADEVVV